MAESKAVFLVGYFGFGNAGDEAILAAMLLYFRGRRADLHFVVASGDPERTARDHNVEAIRWNDIAAILRTVQRANVVVIGGGGLFHDYWGVDPETFLTDRHWGVTYYAGPALLAVLYSKPLMLFGVGIGPLYSGHGRKFTRVAAEAAYTITVRDDGSQAALEALGIPKEKIRITADPAFLFQPATSSGLTEALPVGVRLERPVLTVAARYWDLGVHPDFLERQLAGALDLFLKDSGGTVVLLPFQSMESGKENDVRTAGRIRGHMRLADRAVIAAASSADQIYGCVRDSDLVLGMRLHALIFAALTGVPAVALSYDPKVDQIQRRLGLASYTLDARDITTGVLRECLMEALKGGRQLGEAARFAAAELREAALSNISTAVDLFDVLPGEPVALPDGFGLFEYHKFDQERRKNDERIQALEAALQTASEAGVRTSSRLREVESEREAALREIGRFAATLQNNLSVYRSQRAWKAMLLLRKGYTLFMSSKLRFLAWTLRVLLGRPGDLREHDLVFPYIASYIPETFRRPVQRQAQAVTTPARPETAPVPDVPAPKGYDVVILAIIDFDFRFQRPQQIAVELARQGHRVFWVSPTRFLPPSSPEAYQTVPLRDRLWEIHLRSRQPDIYMGELTNDDVQTMATDLADVYRRWGITEHVFMVQLPFWRRLALRLRELHGSKLLYDCMDDWETFENMGAFNVREEKDLVRECDVLVVTGAELERKFRARGLDPVLVRNGADYGFFAAARSNDLLNNVQHPVVGYFGAIADWIDLDLVYEVAKARPQYSFVLIGQVFGRDVTTLEGLPNVHLLGNKPYTDIPAYLRGFDVCLIPFLLNQVTKATDPVKLYEYLSQGKPVVATNMAELAQCGDLLYIAGGVEDFARKLDSAVAEKDKDVIHRRIEFARANTWTVRVGQIDRITRKAFPLVSILIVTHNSSAYVRACLDSILRNTSYPSYEVVLVDNASSDETLSLLEEYAARHDRFRMHKLPENLGFAGGNNCAARYARGEHLIFLNIDTMVTSGWVGRLLRHIHRDPSIGILCPVTNFAGNEVKINVNYQGSQEMERFARTLASEKDGQKIEIQVAPLYCALMPRHVWECVGELDTRYEIGMFEDDDLSMRVRQAGFRTFAAEDCFIHHFGQGAFSKLSDETYNRIFEANRKRFEEKWNRPWSAHRTRPGVRPAYEEERFEPAQFVSA